MKFKPEHLINAKTRDDLIKIAKENNIPISKTLYKLKYESELRELQSEFVNLQKWIAEKKMRVAIIFEGRDAAGKGGSIKRFKEHLSPRTARVVALTKPTIVEQGQWYFRRYIKVLPNPGEIVFFDRSWYNRAVVEPVNGFCTKKEYKIFMSQVNDFERMLVQSDTYLIKLYFLITKKEQAERFKEIKANPLKRWKMTSVDKKAQTLWDDYTEYKKRMFEATNLKITPWLIIDANKKSVVFDKNRVSNYTRVARRIPLFNVDI